ncbi:hypothetical protein [Thomasclavelia sp.]
MIVSTINNNNNYVTDIIDGEYVLKVNGRNGIYQRPTNILASAYATCMNITVCKLLVKKSLKYDKVIVKIDFDNSNLKKQPSYIK